MVRPARSTCEAGYRCHIFSYTKETNHLLSLLTYISSVTQMFRTKGLDLAKWIPGVVIKRIVHKHQFLPASAICLLTKARASSYFHCLRYSGSMAIISGTRSCVIAHDRRATLWYSWYALQWRHNGRDSVSNHQPHGCLLNRLFRRRSKKHQSSASLAFVWGIHRDRWIPRTKGQLRGKWFHLMTSSWSTRYCPYILCHCHHTNQW